MLAFIPYVPPPPPPPRAVELGRRLAETIEQFRLQHADLNRADVMQATQIAAAQGGGACAAPPRAVLLAVVAAVLAGLFVALATSSGDWGSRPAVAMIAVAIAVAAALLLVVLKRR